MRRDESLRSSENTESKLNNQHRRQHTYVVDDLERHIGDSGIARPTNINWRSNEDNEEQERLLSVPDPGIIASLEGHANAISSNVDVLLRDLRGSLHGMSDLTLESIECFTEAAGGACDAVDAVIKNTYAMLAKVEEFDQSMESARQLHQQVKDIKRVVDLFETQLLTGHTT